MLEFEHFQHHIDAHTQKYLETELKKTSTSYIINLAYHNIYHFSNNQDYDVVDFLEDLHKLIDSKTFKVIVMGGEHMDTGHISQAFFQRDDNGVPQFMMVKDTYIRFKILCSNPRFLKVLNENKIYHYLTKPPTILWLALSPRYPVHVWTNDQPFNHKIIPSFDWYLTSQRLPTLLQHKSIIKN